MPAATDIMAFTRLGNVFASVMTSNIVFLGLATARHSVTLAVHAAVSFAGYTAGVWGGSRLARRPSPADAGVDGAGGPWTRWVTAALALEAAVLAGFFGTDVVRLTTTSEGLPGVVRTFDRFSVAAGEAGKSRIYGGIHWEFDNADGLACGREIGEHVARSFFRPREAAKVLRPPMVIPEPREP